MNDRTGEGVVRVLGGSVLVALGLLGALGSFDAAHMIQNGAENEMGIYGVFASEICSLLIIAGGGTLVAAGGNRLIRG